MLLRADTGPEAEAAMWKAQKQRVMLKFLRVKIAQLQKGFGRCCDNQASLHLFRACGRCKLQAKAGCRSLVEGGQSCVVP